MCKPQKCGKLHENCVTFPKNNKISSFVIGIRKWLYCALIHQYSWDIGSEQFNKNKQDSSQQNRVILSYPTALMKSENGLIDKKAPAMISKSQFFASILLRFTYLSGRSSPIKVISENYTNNEK